jgi:hypothetical protein
MGVGSPWDVVVWIQIFVLDGWKKIGCCLVKILAPYVVKCLVVGVGGLRGKMPGYEWRESIVESGGGWSADVMVGVAH